MKMNIIARLTGLALFSLCGMANASIVTFSDTFDSVSYTDNHWTSIFPSTTSLWTHSSVSGDSYDGYQGITNTAYHTAGVITDTGPLQNANLGIQATLKVGADTFPDTHDIGGIFFGLDSLDPGNPATSVFVGGFTADSDQLFINMSHGDDNSLKVIGDDEVSMVISSGLDHDKYYRLVLSTNDFLATLSIFDDFSGGENLLGTVALDLGIHASSYGFNGIFAQELATFDYFSVTGTAPVPEPATMLLLGAGLAGLAGTKLRRKR